VAFFAPIRIALVHHVPSAQPLGQLSPRRARAGYPQQDIEKYPVRRAGAAFAR